MENYQVGAKAVELVVSQLERNEYGIPASPTTTMVAPGSFAGETIRRGLAVAG